MNTFKQKLIYYGKDILLSYVYVIVCGLIGLILCWATTAGLMDGYVCSMLSFINMTLYCVVIAHSYMKTAEEAMRVKHSNDLERREMLKARYYRELDKVSEYNVSKLYVYILPMVIPAVLLGLLAGVLAIFKVDTSTVEFIVRNLYGFVYSFAFGISKNASGFWALFAVIIMVAPIVFGYIKGAKDVLKEYARIERIKQSIDGDK